MAPKRVQQRKGAVQDLFHDYDIIFEGPKQPSAWPTEYRHTFNVVREIWAVRYDTYCKDSKLPPHLLRERKKLVGEIAKKARKLRYANEDTWRDLEQDVMRMFSTTAICQECKNELYKIEYEARPLESDSLAELLRRRRRRRFCTCHEKNVSVETELQDPDDAQPIIFCALKSHAMTHWHLDKFGDISIPMEPDRTIGLSASSRMQQALRTSSSNIDHYPLRGPNEVLYPFLLIEAKRALKTPGFAAIEAQTAFPLRRILLLQDALRKESSVEFCPLAWFFANQGEEWRLYAGILNENKVHVFDLWHGTVESVDGSLQILLIVDYVWTWARDVYRPQIRDALCALTPSLRNMTPSTLRSLSRSQSVLSEARSIPLRTSQADVAMEDSQSTIDLTLISGEIDTRDCIVRLKSYLETSRANHEETPSQTTVWHSDLVRFSFCCVRLSMKDLITSDTEVAGTLATTVFRILFVEEAIAILQWRHIHALERLWTGHNSSMTVAHAAEVAGDEWNAVSLRFSSLCRREDWQIVRHLDCLIWELTDSYVGNRPSQDLAALAWRQGSIFNHHTHLTATLTAIRNISGEMSVHCALNEIKLIFTGFSLSGTPSSIRSTVNPFLNKPQTDDSFTTLIKTARRFFESSRIVTLGQLTPDTTLIGDLVAAVPLSQATGQMHGMIAIKPESWPAQCPIFCLFVLVDIEVNDRFRLGRVLREALHYRYLYGPLDARSRHEELKLTPENRKILRRWIGSFK